jgi:hypothetical protein
MQDLEVTRLSIAPLLSPELQWHAAISIHDTAVSVVDGATTRRRQKVSITMFSLFG